MAGGSATPQASAQSSQTFYAPWFNKLQEQLGDQIGQMSGEIPALQQSIMNGGQATAPANNIWTQPQGQMVQPAQILPQPQIPNYSGGGGGALNNLPTGGK